MNKNLTFLRFIVVSKKFKDSLNEIQNYDPKYYGTIFSSEDEIKVNNVDNGYSILYDDETLRGLSPLKLFTNIASIIKNNIPNTDANFTITYLYNGDDDVSVQNMDINIASMLLSIDDSLNENRTKFLPLIYYRSNSIIDIANNIKSLGITSSIEKNREYNTSLKKEDTSLNDIYSFINKYIDDCNEYIDDCDNDGYEKKKKKKKKKIYNSSRILKAANSPKRAYYRHGVLVFNNKKAAKKDEEIIKDFLKDFIPGNSEWKKKFRKDLLKRWIKAYAISKGNLKKLEKNWYENERKKSITKRNKRVVDFTRKMLTVPVDHWSDPNH